jgi:hypothetical protein
VLNSFVDAQGVTGLRHDHALGLVAQDEPEDHGAVDDVMDLVGRIGVRRPERGDLLL